MNKKITHLKRIQIKNLWGEVDIDWQLNSHVNILIGINGSGKATTTE
jgi:predicted ATPase